MARITIEDALKQINNRFKLIQIAAKRARKISVYGSHALVDWDKNSPIIVALREIACGYKFDDKGNYIFKDIISKEQKPQEQLDIQSVKLNSLCNDDLIDKNEINLVSYDKNSS